MRVALVHDWLDTWGGGENVLRELRALHPGADLHTLVDFLRADERARLGPGAIRTSFFQHLPFARRTFRYAAILYPAIVRRFDLAAYDLVLSDSHSVAKAVGRRPGQIHVCYCYSPARFAWIEPDLYVGRVAGGSAWKRRLAHRLLARLRDFDRRASRDVDVFLAISEHIAAAILRCYGRTARVIYPPVDGARFAAIREPRGSDYVTVSRLVPYKRLDVLVDAFRLLPERRLVVIGDGPERDRLAARCPPNVELAGEEGDDAVARRVATARAFLIAAREDFGIAPLEAQAAGTPVIAFREGGVAETIRGLDAARPTGVWFESQTPDAVVGAIRDFEAAAHRIDADACRGNAARFAPERFRREITAAIEAAIAARRSGTAAGDAG